MNGCWCTIKDYHRERTCICSCHERIRHDAAKKGWETRRKIAKVKAWMEEKGAFDGVSRRR